LLPINSVEASSPNVLDLKEGWNLISLPVKPATPFTAKTFLEEITLQNGQADKIARWEGNRYEIFVYGYDVNNFRLSPNTAYFLKVETPTQLVVKGTPQKPSTVSLSTGWNALGFSYDLFSLKAGDLLLALNASAKDQITAHTIAQKPAGSSWQTFIKIYNPTNQKVENLGQDFNLVQGLGVFLKTNKDLLWKP